MEHREIWDHIRDERTALAATLAELAPGDWERESLCAGWRVQDVAAHMIGFPQSGLTGMIAMTPSLLRRGFNGMIDADTKRRGQQPREQILADFDRYAASTRHLPVTTSVEPLIDALVHHQDIVRPLGLRHDMPVAAAMAAADRVRAASFLFGTRSLLRAVRLEAADADWKRGSGPVVAGPMQELLMLATGREPDRSLLTGDGVAHLR